MAFPFNHYFAAFAGAFLTTLLALPLWRKWCLCVKLVDDPGQRKIHDQPIPLAGGLAVLTGILLPLAAGNHLQLVVIVLLPCKRLVAVLVVGWMSPHSRLVLSLFSHAVLEFVALDKMSSACCFGHALLWS